MTEANNFFVPWHPTRHTTPVVLFYRMPGNDELAYLNNIMANTSKEVKKIYFYFFTTSMPCAGVLLAHHIMYNIRRSWLNQRHNIMLLRFFIILYSTEYFSFYFSLPAWHVTVSCLVLWHRADSWWAYVRNNNNNVCIGYIEIIDIWYSYSYSPEGSRDRRGMPP